MKRNLILGFCTGYRFEQIESFVASAIGAVQSAQLCLFTSGLDERFYHVAASHDVRVENATPYLNTGIHPQNARYFAYRRFLREHGHAYGHVLLTDVRDVFFQGDPFAQRHPRQVCFAVEDEKLLTEQVNRNWVRDIYGDAVLDSIADNYVACSGTTLGTVAGAAGYLDVLCTEMEVRSYDRMQVYDQGIHNFIVWKLRPGWGWVDQADVFVSTVGCTSHERMELIDDLVLVDGKIPPVVHQWDRHAILRDHVAEGAAFKMSGPA